MRYDISQNKTELVSGNWREKIKDEMFFRMSRRKKFSQIDWDQITKPPKYENKGQMIKIF